MKDAQINKDCAPPVAGMKTKPYGFPLMMEAWVGCVLWAAQQREFRYQFTKKTGLKLENILNRSGLEAAIDKATGHEREVIAAFCDYVTENMWGTDTEEITVIEQMEKIATKVTTRRGEASATPPALVPGRKKCIPRSSPTGQKPCCNPDGVPGVGDPETK